MAAWRILAAIGCLLAQTIPGSAQTATLAEPVQPGDCFHIDLQMQLTGTMTVQTGAGLAPLKVEASSSHVLDERVMSLGATGLPDKSARVFQKALATITVDGGTQEKTLRPERKLIVGQRKRDQYLAYCPTGALMQSELDVAGDHFDLLSVVGVLPGKSVSVGDTWKISNAAAQGLCNFEGLVEHKLTGKLESVKDGLAAFTVTGTANGIDLGAQVKLDIDAKGEFDLKTKRVTSLVWKQIDDRDAGPVNPKTRLSTTITLKRSAMQEPATLTNVALISVPADDQPPAHMTQLDYRDAQSRFDLLYAREWHIVSANNNRLIMRMMDRGDHVAQVTITPWTKADKGKHLTPEEFTKAMNETPGWELGTVLQASEVTSATEGRWIYRLSLQGKLDDVEVLQNYYLVAGPDGDQVVVAFTMTPKQADKLGARDLALVGSLDVPGGMKKDNPK